MSHGYPILLDVTRRKIVIVGGGRVAARKAAGLVEAGAADVSVVSPDFVASFPPSVNRIEQAYDARTLEGASLVFAATNRWDVNDQIVRDARRLGILVNRADADDDYPGDFTTPAKHHDEHVMITVSAGSAALAASIRDALRNRWDPRWTKMANAMQTLRPWIRDHPTVGSEQRPIIFRLLASDDAMNVLDAHGIDALRDWIIERHPELR